MAPGEDMANHQSLSVGENYACEFAGLNLHNINVSVVTSPAHIEAEKLHTRGLQVLYPLGWLRAAGTSRVESLMAGDNHNVVASCKTAQSNASKVAVRFFVTTAWLKTPVLSNELCTPRKQSDDTGRAPNDDDTAV